MSQTAVREVESDELVALRQLGLDGALSGEAKISCSALATRLETSSQTASRRLQALEAADLITRETVADGQWIAITDGGERALRTEYDAYRRLFEGKSSVDLEGTVTGGMGEGKHYISLPGYMEQFEERLGYAPFPGTLNVELGEESVRRRGAMEAFEPVHIDGWEDDERTYGPCVCYPATVVSEAEYDGAHVIAPERTHHDEGQLELIAPVKLREELALSDGDRLTVRVEEK
ncbi:CTP-dependent riboflavin kinase [Halalkalicoccus sp. NIPERK01]|uniref:CTP-dependent riboflavin kinase n=1 Tax=Halalkalicoccus sp. NIPERK01 TaxID=3053469 RepID=UPI00256EAC0F|nr:CTP-dependent riboflavin kinase [Halalkalicoccus sp. NIPERK01]MDL5363541.1 CTP-dependent riboflavin kinase [Halalkalicoccus sp. NIPERK01]